MYEVIQLEYISVLAYTRGPPLACAIADANLISLQEITEKHTRNC